MPEVHIGGRICFPVYGSPPPKSPSQHPTGPEPNPPGMTCIHLTAHRVDLSRHASAEVDLDPGLADVSILFSVHELVDQINNDDLKKGILASVTSAIDSMAAKLAPGVELHFNDKVFRAGRASRSER
jgi:hypothetical protein